MEEGLHRYSMKWPRAIGKFVDCKKNGKILLHCKRAVIYIFQFFSGTNYWMVDRMDLLIKQLKFWNLKLLWNNITSSIIILLFLVFLQLSEIVVVLSLYVHVSSSSLLHFYFFWIAKINTPSSQISYAFF